MQIKLKALPTITYVCLMVLLLCLGNWQLGRAKEKRLLLDLLAGRENSAIVSLTAATDNLDELRYRKVQVKGHYDVYHQFLLDNQINAGKAGYFVLTPFWLENINKAVLVNRGWLPLNQNRNILPDLPLEHPELALLGRVNRFPSVGIKLAGADMPAKGWPSVVQVVDSTKLAKKLGYPLFNFQIELDSSMPDGFKREWQAAKMMQPEQHFAYAMQWFGLAFTLTALFIWHSFK